jgi:hypothetical protein
MSARLLATDSTQQELLVADFETALGTLPHARLRTSDIVAIRVPLEEHGQGDSASRSPMAVEPASHQPLSGGDVTDKSECND